jgi:peptidoglycan hydrolase-like protein with peptidoglycan-binding domain
MEVQKLVGVTPDGAYGPLTKAAVEAWQANNGLVPVDGIFGAMSRAKAYELAGSTGTFPAGCTSNEGFSSTTGLSCAVVVGTLPAGCTSTVGFSPTTGQSCSVVTTLPAGCTSTVGYSSTTGAKCDGGSTPRTTGPLTGAEGDITVSSFTSGTETTIGEGKSEKVLGVKVEADNGSDVSLSTMKVVIDGWDDGADDKGSSRLERHIDGVDIYMGSTKVGSADVEDFSKNSGVYSTSVSLSNAIVRKGQSEKFYVSVTAASSIDSENEDNTWDVDVTSIRFQDAMGVVMTVAEDGSTFKVLDATIDFESATANDEISITSSSNNPEATTLKVSDSGTSDEYLVFAFKLKADKDSSDLNVLEVPIKIETGIAGVENVISDIYLKVGSKTYDDFDVKDGDKDEAVYTFTIDEGDLTLDSGETVEVKVYVEFMKEGLPSTYTTGETVQFTLISSDLEVENTDGDSVDTSGFSDKEGNEMILSTSSTVVTNVTTGSTIDRDGKVATYTFKFTVEADGADVILSDATIAETVSQSVVPSFSIKKDSGTATGTLGETYTVADGDTASFTVTYTVDPAGPATTGTYYVTIDTIAGISVDKTAGPETITTL